MQGIGVHNPVATGQWHHFIGLVFSSRKVVNFKKYVVSADLGAFQTNVNDKPHSISLKEMDKQIPVYTSFYLRPIIVFFHGMVEAKKSVKS